MLFATILALAVQAAPAAQPADARTVHEAPAASEGTAGGDTAAPAAADGEDSNEVICRTSKVTGSLSQRRRDCRTRAQWANIAGAAREDAEAMRAFKGSSRSD